jgi:2-polyprenyl-3-methyl-5-hydroxy-6-metoxy-1,4-benzoquinol methylase
MTTMSASETPANDFDSRRQRRWEEEAKFFDDRAHRLDDAKLVVDPLAFQRYSRPVLRKRFNKEFRFQLMRPLAGKTLLDVGCGDGANAVMFAKMGARVTGLDISPGAIDAAQRSAALNGVSDRTSFRCAPIETADLPPQSFDIVWGDGILHHVLDDLELVLQHLARWTKSSGLLLFSEPVNLANPMRVLRSFVPVHTEATPDERPLVKEEVELVRRYIPNLRMRHYALFGRLDQFILPNCNYEKSSIGRRGIVNAIDTVDYALLSLPLIERLGGMSVMYGQPARA